METFRSKEQWLAGVTEAIKNEIINNNYTIDDANRTSRKAQLMELATSKIVMHKVTKQIGKDSIDIDQKLFEPIWSQSILKDIDVAMLDASAQMQAKRNKQNLEDFISNYKPELDIGEALWRQLFFITAKPENLHNSVNFLGTFYNNILDKGNYSAYVLSAQECGQQGKSTWMDGVRSALSNLGISHATGALPTDNVIEDTFSKSQVVFINDAKWKYLNYEELNNIIDKRCYQYHQKYQPYCQMKSNATLAIGTNYLPKAFNIDRYNILDVYTGYGIASMKTEYSGWKNIPNSRKDMDSWLEPAVKTCLYYASRGAFKEKYDKETYNGVSCATDNDEFYSWYSDKFGDKGQTIIGRPADFAKDMLPNGSRMEIMQLRADLTSLFRSKHYIISEHGHSVEYAKYSINISEFRLQEDEESLNHSGNKELVWEFFHDDKLFRKYLQSGSRTTSGDKVVYDNSISSNELGSIKPLKPLSSETFNEEVNDISREVPESGLMVKHSNDGTDDTTVHAYYESDEYQHAQPAVWDETNLHEDDNRKEFMLLNTPLSQKPTGAHKTINTNDNVKQDNFLFECDGLSLDEQKKQLSSLPEEVYKSVHSAIYSGHKSLHVVITTNFGEQKGIIPGSEYTNRLRKLLWNKLNDKYFGGNGDQACSNAARLTRAPNVLRHLKDDAGEDIKVLQDCSLWNDHPIPLDVHKDVDMFKYTLELEAQTNKIEHDKHNNKQYGEKTEEQKLAAYAKARPEKWQPVLDLLDGKDLGSGANYIGYIGMLKAAGMDGLASQAAEMAHNLHPTNIGFKHI